MTGGSGGQDETGRSDQAIRADLRFVERDDASFRQAVQEVRAGTRKRLPDVLGWTERREVSTRLTRDVPALLARAVRAERRIAAVRALCDASDALSRRIWDEMDDYADIGDPKGLWPGSSPLVIQIRAALDGDEEQPDAGWTVAAHLPDGKYRVRRTAGGWDVLIDDRDHGAFT